VRVLVVNAGSSSLKLRLLGDDDELAGRLDLDAEGGGGADAEAVGAWLRETPAPDAVGHRVVHGGERFIAPVVLDAEVRAALEELVDLAPLHQPKSLDAIDLVGAALPETPAVACFDTSFHATLEPAAYTYAVPAAWRERWGVRKFGFHGLSHAYAARRAAEMVGRDDLRLVSCHLGAGASVTASHAGRSVDTSMGFTPLDGLVMATRSGSLDPGLLLWLLEHERLREPEMAQALEHKSGLLALAGTPHMSEVISRAVAGDERARLAFEVYVHRLRGTVAEMAAALEGIDALLFTGGVGENAPAVRAAAAAGLGFLGVELDERANASARGDDDVSARHSRVRVLVVRSREDLEIARQVRATLGG
jgi:acetate kinase